MLNSKVGIKYSKVWAQEVHRHLDVLVVVREATKGVLYRSKIRSGHSLRFVLHKTESLSSQSQLNRTIFLCVKECPNLPSEQVGGNSRISPFVCQIKSFQAQPSQQKLTVVPRDIYDICLKSKQAHCVLQRKASQTLGLAGLEQHGRKDQANIPAETHFIHSNSLELHRAPALHTVNAGVICCVLQETTIRIQSFKKFQAVPDSASWIFPKPPQPTHWQCNQTRYKIPAQSIRRVELLRGNAGWEQSSSAFIHHHLHQSTKRFKEVERVLLTAPSRHKTWSDFQ